MRRSVSLLFLAALVALFHPSPARAQATPLLGRNRRFVPYPTSRPRAGLPVQTGSCCPSLKTQALFSLLGTTFGGDGRTTFALPDLRGRAPIGMGQEDLVYAPYDLGRDRAAVEEVTLTLSQIPSHTHVAHGSHRGREHGLACRRFLGHAACAAVQFRSRRRFR